jgi:hypothetical protein
VFLRIALFVLAAALGAAVVPPGAAAPADTAAQPPEPKVRVDFYGYAKLDASWDSSLVDSGDFARWVASPEQFVDHDHFNMTARQTRAGVLLEGGGREDLDVRGRIEIDFYGGGAENKNQPQLRHAYMELDWKERGWRVLAGQASDVISPLNPDTLNYTVAWWAGNIGYRRPQVRASRSVRAGGERQIAFMIAATRTIGDDFGAEEPGDTGADSGLPTLQGRAALSWTRPAGRRGTLGLFAHIGEETLHGEAGMDDLEVESWSAGFDIDLPLADRLSLRAEGWVGSNLDDYFGGIGNGINLDRGRGVSAAGGWASFELRSSSGHRLSFGAGLDDPDNADLASGSRARNLAIWGMYTHSLTPAVEVGAEISHWETRYIDLEAGRSWRAQTAFVYKF